jgi:hypothetical protein
MLPESAGFFNGVPSCNKSFAVTSRPSLVDVCTTHLFTCFCKYIHVCVALCRKLVVGPFAVRKCNAAIRTKGVHPCTDLCNIHFPLFYRLTGGPLHLLLTGGIIQVLVVDWSMKCACCTPDGVAVVVFLQIPSFAHSTHTHAWPCSCIFLSVCVCSNEKMCMCSYFLFNPP